MSSVVISGDTSGAITLAAPSVAGTNTITLPATTGTMLVSDSSGNSSASAFIPTGSTIPTNGVYLPSSNTVGIATNSTSRIQVNSSGIMTNPYQPAFLATGTGGSITITSGSNIPFNSLNATFASSTRSSGYNTSTYVYTAPVAGLYYFYAQVYLSTMCSLAWLKNNSQLAFNDIALWSYYNGSGITQITGGSVIVELAAGDYISTRVRSGEVNENVYMGHSCFLGYLIG